jgi:hypothetical protein
MTKALAIFILLVSASVAQASWIFLPSTYTHRDGERVVQYTKPAPAYRQDDTQWRHWIRIHRDTRGNYHRWETWYKPYQRND